MALPFLFSAYSELLAKPFTYHQVGNNCINDLIIWHGHLWGGIFQMSAMKEYVISGGNG
jgi:hypothetical protein